MNAYAQFNDVKDDDQLRAFLRTSGFEELEDGVIASSMTISPISEASASEKGVRDSRNSGPLTMLHAASVLRMRRRQRPQQTPFHRTEPVQLLHPIPTL
jgi:hypothetical protein